MAELQHYTDGKGHVYSMTKEHAERVGFKPAGKNAGVVPGAVDLAEEQAHQTGDAKARKSAPEDKQRKAAEDK